MLDMKVLINLILENKNWKKMKSPSSMRNGRFHASKSRGKVQKMGVLYTHSPKMPGSSPNFFKKLKEKKEKENKRKEEGPAHSLLDCRPRQATNGHPLIANGCPKFALYKILLPPLAYIFLHMWSTLAGWLAIAHACPAQTSPKNFKHP
jgi:hypothetical protein